MDECTFPEFIGIGAARSGTTWLTAQLGKHPNIWIPRIKELHYFTRDEKYYGSSHLTTFDMWQRIFSNKDQFKKYRYHLLRAIGSNIRSPSLKKLRWDCSYLFRNPDDEWYSRLFNDGIGRVRGEVTPQYSMLDHADIKKLHSLIPDCKILFIVRNPVERAWSLVRYHEKRFTPNLTNLPHEQLILEALHPAKLLQSDYRSILNRWRDVWPEDQFHLCFYDQISEQPDQLIEDLSVFLGIDIDKFGLIPTDNSKKINQSFDKSMPEEFRKSMIDYYYEEVRLLSESEGGYFSNWLETFDEILNKS
jgi:hypothetical protein